VVTSDEIIIANKSMTKHYLLVAYHHNSLIF